MTNGSQTTPDLDPIAQQLISQAREISRLRRDLDDLASATMDTAADVVSRLEDLESPEPSTHTPTAWCWRDLGPKGQEELRRQLTEWVAWLRGRYPLARRIPPCWADHPEIVEELTALWLAWQQAYQERNASLTAAADWHDRWLPGVLHRLDHGPFAVDCSLEHHARPDGTYDRQSQNAR